MAGDPTLVYLADLTHTGQLVAANTQPLGVGLVGAYLLAHLPGEVEVELFKYPDDLGAALARRWPRVMGFANYSWNANLAREYARRVKALHPETVIVFGGPNFGLAPEEQDAFWTRHPHVDFYVVKEGEAATLGLVRALAAHGWDAGALKRAGTVVPSVQYVQEGRLVAGPLLPRLADVDAIPSPYLAGLMDKFFDGVLIPMTFTTRGCPFRCTFCTEGTDYYRKVAKRTRLEDELVYIAERVGTVQDLIITDANFGMFKEDRAKAEAVARVQRRFGWPRHIHVSGGKNQKERLLEVATIIDGAMNVAASLQSTDPQVLENVRRANISLDELNHVGRDGSRIDANTYAEIILGLPGDSLAAHTRSVRDAVNAGLSFIRLYQLIMLPETEMNTPATRARFGMQTKFRAMPRCFGAYEILGERVPCIEVEEICVAQDTLPFADYVEARELDLTVEITHNVTMFRELFGLCRHLGLSWFDFLLRFHAKRRAHGPALAALYDGFRDETVRPLWESREELERYAAGHVDRYVRDELGTNELFKAKALAFFRLQRELHDALYAEMAQVLVEQGCWTPALAVYLDELKAFSMGRKQDLLDGGQVAEASFQFDFRALMQEDFGADPQAFRLGRPVRLRFQHSDEQREVIGAYVRQYGTSVVGLGRILMRAHVKRLFREVRALELGGD
ncbi:MAG: cobalamin-dependent protein [Candidatus Binatia bacterium]